MEQGFRQDLEREEFSLRQRGTLTAIPLKASMSNRHWIQRQAIEKLSLSGDQTTWLTPAFMRHWGPGKNLCLFNIIVAFEWMPNYNDLRLLREATTSASVLLYDVTDGYMAIGRVCVGGKELMDCADIQIFASNRLFPRSTVDGLNESHKYQPIRLGRGLWHRNSRITLPWDSEIGFATLIHEWGHYALGLKDQYLEVKPEQQIVVPIHNPVLNTIMAGPKKSELLATILPEDPNTSTTDNDSEWSALSTHSTYAWLEIPMPYQNREIPPPQQLTPAYRLVGALRADAIGEEEASVKGNEASEEVKKDGMTQKDKKDASQDTRYQQPHPILRWDLENGPQNQIDNKHCWVYIVKGESIYTPTALIAQGEVESMGTLVDHTISGPALRLLGAEVGDMIVLVGHRKTAVEEPDTPLAPLVLCATIDRLNENHEIESDNWDDVTPNQIPRVSVKATIAAQAKRNQPATYNLSLSDIDLNAWKVFICPLGDQEPLDNAPNKQGVTALDGHVMLVPPNGDHPYIMIAGYSLGGSPDSGFPVHPNPIPAGSSDGNAMIFFYDQRKGTKNDDDQNSGSSPAMVPQRHVCCRPLDYADMDVKRQWLRRGGFNPTQTKETIAFDQYRIVVTTNYLASEDEGVELTIPDGLDLEFQPHPEKRAQPRSYTFGLTSNLPLTPLRPSEEQAADREATQKAHDFLPTLVLYYDNQTDEADQRKLLLARYDRAANSWTALPTVLPGKSVVALSLNADTAPGLFPQGQEPLRTEYFRLFLVPE